MSSRPKTSCILILAACAAAAPSQLAPGTIGIVKSSTAAFATISPLGTVTTHVVGPFSGTGAPTSILHDPLDANAFLIGGAGFLGRASFGAGGAVTWTLLGTTTGSVEIAGVDAAGRYLFGDEISDQIRAFNPATGTFSNVTSGPQAFGALISALYDERNEVMYVGSVFGRLYRMSLAGGVPGPVTQLGPSLGSGLNLIGLALDPFDCSVVATALAILPGIVPRIVRFSPGGTVTDLVAPGTPAIPNGIAADLRGDFVLVRSANSVEALSNSTGTVTALPSVTFTGSMRGVAVARPPLLAPRLDLHAPAPGAVTLRVQGCEGSLWMILVSLIPANPTGSGPILGLNADVFPQLFNPVFTGAPSACGGAKVDILGGVPPGIAVDALALDLLGPGVLLAISAVVPFTTF